MTLRTLREISYRTDDPETVLAVLDRIGLLKINIPAPDVYNLSSLSDSEKVKRLSAAGIGFSVARVDEALSETKLPTEERIAFKLAMAKHGLLRGAA